MGLQCHSCGSLLDPDQADCTKFDPEDPRQSQTCRPGEACLLYTWSQTQGEPDITVRECMSTDVLLGPITDPLLPAQSCTVKDISEEADSFISACLCETDYCNAGGGEVRSEVRSEVRTPTRRTTRRTTRRPERQSTTARPRLSQQTFQPPPASPASCPADYTDTPAGCIYVSPDRVGWIEARKKCEQRSGLLLSVQTRDKMRTLEQVLVAAMRRKREEFWLSGNDIEEEGQWEWAKLRSPVPQFGWTDSPYSSHEENCLSWSVEAGDSHWHGASCCNNLRYICELIRGSVVK